MAPWILMSLQWKVGLTCRRCSPSSLPSLLLTLIKVGSACSCTKGSPDALCITFIAVPSLWYFNHLHSFLHISSLKICTGHCWWPKTIDGLNEWWWRLWDREADFGGKISFLSLFRFSFGSLLSVRIISEWLCLGATLIYWAWIQGRECCVFLRHWNGPLRPCACTHP